MNLRLALVCAFGFWPISLPWAAVTDCPDPYAGVGRPAGVDPDAPQPMSPLCKQVDYTSSLGPYPPWMKDDPEERYDGPIYVDNDDEDDSDNALSVKIVSSTDVIALPAGAKPSATTPVRAVPQGPKLGSGEGVDLDALEGGTTAPVDMQYNTRQKFRLGETDALQGHPLNMKYANDLDYLKGYTQGSGRRGGAAR